MATPARRLALDVLVRLERGRLPLPDLLSSREIEALPPRERDFLHELLLGSLRRRGAIDRALGRVVDQPLERLDVGVVAALRLGAHQLLHLRVPARAAVHESVALARERRPKSAGLVNAVLRRLAREGPAAALDPHADPLAWLTAEGSLPRWLAERWLLTLGVEGALARARALQVTPDVVFRLNPRKPEAWERAREAGLDPEPLAGPEGAFRARMGRPGTLAREGLLYVQDLGSQVAARLAARPGCVLDACAAPGGKALLLADAAPGSTIVAAERVQRRMATLAQLVARWGAANVRLVRADVARPPFAPGFDSVLLDAPCSGLGMLARRPDIRWRARQEEIARHAERQRRFLESLSPLVAPSGTLVYAVCSLEPEETEAVARAFLAAHRDFEPLSLPSWCEPFRAGPFVLISPERHGSDGFFVAPLRRR